MLRTIVVFAIIALAIIVLRLLAWHALRSAIGRSGKPRAALDRAGGGHALSDPAGRLGERVHRFLAARARPDRFIGLPLTLLCMAALCLLGLVGGLVTELPEARAMIRFDQWLNGRLSAVRTDGLLKASAWLTDAGASASIIAVSLVATGLAWAHRRTILIVPLWVTVIGSQLTTYALKYALARTRPEAVTEITAITPSFPSGHATSAMAVYGFVAFLIARELPSARARFEVAWWAAVIIALMGLSRMVLGLHYASDVAAGFLVGGFWLLVGFGLAEHLAPRGDQSAL